MITAKNTENVEEHLKKEIAKKHLIVEGSEEIVKWLAWNGAGNKKKE